MSHFSPLCVSTTTVIASLGVPVDILSTAKYLPLDDVIIGVKMVYARGSSSIMRGAVRIPQSYKNNNRNREGFYKDFYNQVTCTIQLPNQSQRGSTDLQRATLVSCKVFHNGTLHITGSHNRNEAAVAVNHLLTRLKHVRGAKVITLDPTVPFLKSQDNLIYSTSGEVIGWSTGTLSHMHGEFVDLCSVDTQAGLQHILAVDVGVSSVFITSRWLDSKKRVYTVNGKLLGTLRLKFDQDTSRRHYQVKYGYIYVGNRIVGKETFSSVDSLTDESEKLAALKSTIATEEKERRYLATKGVVVRTFAALASSTCDPVSENNCKVHMINTFFQAPFRVNRHRLHRCFLDNGLYSRLSPCENAAVNLRYHYNVATQENEELRGKCSQQNKQSCTCKDISVSCFNSGKMNVAGLATMKQAEEIHRFLEAFFTTHRTTFEVRG